MGKHLNCYYVNQLKKLKSDRVYPQSIKIIDCEGSATNYLNLNSESIPIILDYLKAELKRISKINKEDE